MSYQHVNARHVMTSLSSVKTARNPGTAGLLEQALVPAESCPKSADQHSLCCTAYLVYKEVVVRCNKYREPTNKYLQNLDMSLCQTVLYAVCLL